MALWDGTTFNNAKLASMVDRIFWPNLISNTRRKMGLLYALTGKNEAGAFVDGRFKIKQTNYISGLEHGWRMSGRIRTIPTVSDGANEIAAKSLTYAGNTFAKVTMPLTHYVYTEPIPASDWDLIRGKEAQTESYIQDLMQVLQESMETQWANDMLATGSTPGAGETQARTTLASLPRIVNDSGTYGLNRDDVANADFESYVDSTAGALDIERVGAMQTEVRQIRGGSGSLGLLRVADYNALQHEVRQYLHAYSDPEWDKFGGMHFSVAGTAFVAEQRIADVGDGYLLSPEFFYLVKNGDVPTTGGIVFDDPTMVDAHSLKVKQWLGLYCVAPFKQGRWRNIA